VGQFDNSYVHLPQRFFARVMPTRVAAPRLIRLNRMLAEQIGIDADALDAGFLSGNEILPGAEPLAMAYAGHQFGHFTPQLGDGRAILLGEVVGPDGMRRDVQLKGAGPTPFSRRGDGRAALGPVLREYLVSEAMAALGIPTTRALAAVLSGEPVYRETAMPGAILTRVAASHLRIGTFQFFAARGDFNAVQTLTLYALQRHFPARIGQDRPAMALLEEVIARQAALMADWLLVGFVHGVMNTDNMSISGETIDFGPCAFIDAYDPSAVFSSIDQNGRYAYGNQPRIAQWNLTRLAETLLPQLSDDQDAAIALAEEALAAFTDLFEAAFTSGLRRKLGFLSEQPGDLALGQELLAIMAEQQSDFTLTFRALAEHPATLTDPFVAWLGRWNERLALDGQTPETAKPALQAVNPAVIPRTHQIEAVIRAAVDRSDFGPFETLLAALTDPYRSRDPSDPLTLPPTQAERVWQTFCGT